MSNQKYVASARPGSGNAQVRKYGNSTVKTVAISSLPKKTQNELKR